MELDPRTGRRQSGRAAARAGRRVVARRGVRDRSKDAYLRAVELARATLDGELLGAAALGLGTGQSSQEGFDVSGTADELVIGLLEEALGLLPEADSPLRARLLGRLAVALYWARPGSGSSRSARNRWRWPSARATRSALLGALDQPQLRPLGRRRSRGPPRGRERDPPSRRGARARRLRARGAAVPDHRAARAGRRRRRRPRDRAVLRSAPPSCASPSTAGTRWCCRRCAALMDGRFADTERLAGEALQLAEQAQDPAAVPVWGAQMLFLWWERGQVAELEAALEAIREVAGSMPAVEVTGTWIAAELGRLDEARERFDRLAAAGFEYPHDTTWLTLASSLARDVRAPRRRCPRRDALRAAPAVRGAQHHGVGDRRRVGRSTTCSACSRRRWVVTTRPRPTSTRRSRSAPACARRATRRGRSTAWRRCWRAGKVPATPSVPRRCASSCACDRAGARDGVPARPARRVTLSPTSARTRRCRRGTRGPCPSSPAAAARRRRSGCAGPCPCRRRGRRRRA